MNKLFLLPLTLFGPWFCSFSQDAEFKELERLLAKNFQARGGVEKLRDLHSMKLKGKVVGEGKETKFAIYVKDDKCRIEYKLNNVHVVRIFDGKNGWQINPLIGANKPQPMTPHEEAYMREHTELSGHLVDWSEKKHRIQFLGKANFEGKQQYKLRLKTVYGSRYTVFIDPDTHLETAYIRAGEKKKPIALIVQEYDKINGLVIEKRVAIGDKGCSPVRGRKARDCVPYREVAFFEREYNVIIPESMFQIHAAMASRD